MALIAQQTLDRTSEPGGTAVTFEAAAAAQTMATGDKVFLHVKNASGVEADVTITAVRPCDQGGLHNLVVPVAAGAHAVIGPITDRYKTVATGTAAIAYETTASITVAAVNQP